MAVARFVHYSPAVWLRFVDRAPWGLSPPRHGGFVMGAVSGVLVSGLILAAYWALGDGGLLRAGVP